MSLMGCRKRGVHICAGAASCKLFEAIYPETKTYLNVTAFVIPPGFMVFSRRDIKAASYQTI